MFKEHSAQISLDYFLYKFPTFWYQYCCSSLIIVWPDAVFRFSLMTSLWPWKFVKVNGISHAFRQSRYTAVMSILSKSNSYFAIYSNIEYRQKVAMATIFDLKREVQLKVTDIIHGYHHVELEFLHILIPRLLF